MRAASCSPARSVAKWVVVLSFLRVIRCDQGFMRTRRRMWRALCEMTPRAGAPLVSVVNAKRLLQVWLAWAGGFGGSPLVAGEGTLKLRGWGDALSWALFKYSVHVIAPWTSSICRETAPPPFPTFLTFLKVNLWSWYRQGFVLQASAVPFAGNCSCCSLLDSGDVVCICDCSAAVQYLVPVLLQLLKTFI